MRDRPLILAALVVLIGVLTMPFWYGAWSHTPETAPVMQPAKGAQCIRPAGWMRENHMHLLMELRDEVVHKGIRREHESLSDCMNCHVSKMADGHYPSPTSREFFCNSCHGYVGVRIDCFSCHSNRPSSADTAVQARETLPFTLPFTALAGARSTTLEPGQASIGSPAAGSRP